MFPDSTIAKKFACGHTKTAAVIKEALGPHYLENTLDSISSLFSIMMRVMIRQTNLALYSFVFSTLV